MRSRFSTNVQIAGFTRSSPDKLLYEIRRMGIMSAFTYHKYMMAIQHSTTELSYGFFLSFFHFYLHHVPLVYLHAYHACPRCSPAAALNRASVPRHLHQMTIHMCASVKKHGNHVALGRRFISLCRGSNSRL